MAEEKMLTIIVELILSLWEKIGCIIILYFVCLSFSYFSGFLVSIKDKHWKPRRALSGIWKSIGSLLAVMIGGILDLLIEFMNIYFDPVNINIGDIPVFCCLVLVWCITSELGSISKNARKLGYTMPKFLESGIVRFRDTIANPENETKRQNKESQNDGKNR